MAINSDEQAKAVQEISKTTGKALGLASDAGSYLTTIFGGAIKNLALAAQDSSEGFFIRNRARVFQKTQKYLESRGIDKDNYREIDERSTIPMLEAIIMETDDSLQEVWASYLTNAIDPKRIKVTVSRQLIYLIKNLEPTDLPILTRIFKEDLNIPREKKIRLNAVHFESSENSLEISLTRLAALGLFVHDSSGTVGWAAPEGWQKPCQLEVSTPLGDFKAQPLLMALQNSIDLIPKKF